MKTLKIILSGTVQGVFFRKFIEDKAKNFGLKGFVRNIDDGKVELIIEGEDSKINEMLKISKQGSPHTKIEKTEIQELQHQGFSDFKILRI